MKHHRLQRNIAQRTKTLAEAEGVKASALPCAVQPRDSAICHADRWLRLQGDLQTLQKRKTGGAAQDGREVGYQAGHAGVDVPPSPQDLPILPCPDFSVHDTAFGAAHRVVHQFSAAYRHGTSSVGAACSVQAKELAKLALDISLARIDVRKAVFVDTETTGLAGGAGTLPFLVGVGCFVAEEFCVEQFFLREPGDEKPLLQLLRQRLDDASLLVTYNGKSYDWPLLRSRFVLNRVGLPKELPHLDLLHCSRRVLKRRLGAVRLTEVEKQFLRYEREQDVAGALIPELYFNYLKTRDMRPLGVVFHHNVQDILALAAIMGELVHLFAKPPHAALDPRDRLSFAHLAKRAGDDTRALAFAADISAELHAGDVSAQAALLSASLLVRRKDYARARDVLSNLVSMHDGPEPSAVHLMLSKLYEHKLKNSELALLHAKKARAAEGAMENEQRLQRLRRRLAKGRSV